MILYCEAGGIPALFFDACFEEVMIMLAGYIKRQNKQLQHTRMLMYIIICTVTEDDKRGEVYDVFEIFGDPSKEERQQEKIKMLDSVKAEGKRLTEQLRNENRLKLNR